MVQMMQPGNRRLEIEDPLEDEHGPLHKRSKNSSPFGQCGCGANANALLEEPGPLGLSLRKSPSLLDLIQMKLSHHSQGSASATQTRNLDPSTLIVTEKLKASNFAASLLRIGNWERKSRHEGDLVAKCYFAKRKLVWEVLEGGLKSKIEIQWSDIVGLKAGCPEDGPGTLNVVLARPPLFFRETDPQPRKHTLWHATADFTDGQASTRRNHFLECPQGLLNRHFDRLILCDARLDSLSRQPEMVLDSPYFESRASGFDNVNSGKGSVASRFQDAVSPTTSQSSSLVIDQSEPCSCGVGSEQQSHEAPSPSSVMNSDATVSGRPKSREKVSSMSDLMKRLGDCIPEPGNPEEGSNCQEMLESIAQHLLGDTQQLAMTAAAFDDNEKLMSRVNSLCCCLVQHEDVPSVQNLQAPDSEAELESKDDDSGMSRRDSFTDLLLHLPRITSLPKLLFDISEENVGGQAR